MDFALLDLYANRYADARAAFLASARDAGASTDGLTHPAATDPTGESLAIDVAWFGPRDASRVLVMVAGTHGSEGFAATPIMLALMQSGRLAQLPGNTAVLMVHALNPYGYAYISRTNENNVDLNRNFVDFSRGAPSNPGYEALHPYLCPTDTSEQGRAQARAGMDAWIEQHGLSAFYGAVFNGQYDEPRGVMYGGRQREWSNVALEQIAQTWLAKADHVAFIDWHTGLGEYGQPFFLCFNEAGGPEWDECCRWWGRDRVEHEAGFGGASRPRYSGLVFQGMRRFCRQAAFAGAVVEFGTTPPDTTIHGLQLDNQLRFGADQLDTATRNALHAEAMESFCPSDPDWRVNVVNAGVAIAVQALEGLASWQIVVTEQKP